MLLLSEFVGHPVFNIMNSSDGDSILYLKASSDIGVGGGNAGGTIAPPKVLICQKSGQNLWKLGEKYHKIWAQMFRHLCFHCVMNETDCRNTSEFDFFLLHNTHEYTMKIFFVWLPKKVLIFEKQIFRVSLSKFGHKSFAPPKFACLCT